MYYDISLMLVVLCCLRCMCDMELILSFWLFLDKLH